MVLQRLQSVYLLIAAVLMSVYSFSTIAELGIDSASVDLAMFNNIMPGVEYMWGFFAISILVAILAFITIFTYKTLKLQRSLCRICGCVTTVLLASLMIILYNIQCDNLRISLSNIMPIFAIIFFFLADSGISKDIKILSSYDRIR